MVGPSQTIGAGDCRHQSCFNVNPSAHGKPFMPSATASPHRHRRCGGALAAAASIMMAAAPVNAQIASPRTLPPPRVIDQIDDRSIDVDAGQDRGESRASPRRLPDVGASKIQSGFPAELILPAPSDAARRRADRFVQSQIDPEIPLQLVLGRPKILRLADTPARIFIPDENTIRTEVIDQETGRELAVTGVRAGTTTMMLWFDDPTAPSGQSVVSYLVRVFADPILMRPVGDIEAEINQKFPNSIVELDEIADRLIVRGQASDAIEMSQILQILAGARGVRAGITRPSNPVTVASALDFGGPNGVFGLNNAVGPDGLPLASGQSAIDPLQAEENAAERRRVIDPVALAQAGIINQMKVIGEQQVMLKVTVAEVNRGAARSIGLNFAADNDNGLTVFQTLTGDLAATGIQSSANVLASLDMGQVRLAIEALRTMNLSRTLAEPTLVAMNGQPADFQAGGQFPIPIISGAGGAGGANLQGISFVPFGVQLQFTPFIQDRDVIRLQMNADVSTRDESIGTMVGGGAGGGGSAVSGLNSRNFSTTVQLRSGQTIAVAGLLQTNYGASTERIPFWGDLPFIGSTGGINRGSSGEQELVILVTPHLVAPVDSCTTLPLPGDDVHEPTDIEFFLSNRLESRRSTDFRGSVRTDFARQQRAENCCPELFMIGDVGPTDRCCPRPAPVRHTAVESLPQTRPSVVDHSVVDPASSKSVVRKHRSKNPASSKRISARPQSSSTGQPQTLQRLIQRGPNVQ